MIRQDVKKLIWAIDCCLKGQPVSRDEIGEAAFALAAECGVAGIVSPAYRMRNVRRDMLFEAERVELYRFLEGIGCWYAPMKGLVVSSLYPEAGMRQMADNDILFDVRYREQVSRWFTDRGYRTDWSNGAGIEDVYMKEPMYNFEMHCLLFGSENRRFEAYFADFGTKLLKVESSPKVSEGVMERRMSDEDFYLYMLCHSFKHYSRGGEGLRLLTDVHVYLKARSEVMDWNYVRKELKTLELEEFEACVRSISEKCFGTHDLELTTREEEMLNFLIDSGARGREDRRIAVEVGRLGKVRYLKERLWPPAEFFINEHSECRSNHRKINYYRIKRIRDRFCRREEIMKEFVKVVTRKE